MTGKPHIHPDDRRRYEHDGIVLVPCVGTSLVSVRGRQYSPGEARKVAWHIGDLADEADRVRVDTPNEKAP